MCSFSFEDKVSHRKELQRTQCFRVHHHVAGARGGFRHIVTIADEFRPRLSLHVSVFAYLFSKIHCCKFLCA